MLDKSIIKIRNSTRPSANSLSQLGRRAYYTHLDINFRRVRSTGSPQDQREDREQDNKRQNKTHNIEPLDRLLLPNFLFINFLLHWVANSLQPLPVAVISRRVLQRSRESGSGGFSGVVNGRGVVVVSGWPEWAWPEWHLLGFMSRGGLDVVERVLWGGCFEAC